MLFFLLAIFYFVMGSIEIFAESISKKVLSVIALFPAFFLTAFRDSSIGNDTRMYLLCYNNISSINSLYDAIMYDRMEPGYVFISYFLSHLGISYNGFQFIISLLFYGSLFLFLEKHSKNIGISCFVFLTLRFMLEAMNVVRMYIAIAFILYSVQFIQKKKFTFFLLFILLAASFHKSALLFIILYPLAQISLTKSKIVIMFFISGIIAFLGKAFFSSVLIKLGMFTSYLNDQSFYIGNNFAIYLTFLVDICMAFFLYRLFWCSKNTDLKCDTDNGVISDKKISFTAIVCILCLDIIGLCNTMMGRISGFFTFCWLILYPMAFSRIKNKIESFILFTILSFCLLVYFETIMFFRPEWNHVVPYCFYFGDIF